MKSLLYLILLLLLAQPLCCLSDADEVLGWLNRLRTGEGLPTCSADSRLDLAAADYARRLAAAGRLSHRDEAGGSALDRYHAAGGSATLVGEVLAAASSPEEAGRAWLDSAEHRALLLDPAWSHAGAGSAAWRDLTVYVLLFSLQRVRDLQIKTDDRGYLVSGCLLPALAARRPLLWAGIEMPAPEAWDPESGCFLFRLPAAAGGLYCRLGYRGFGGEVVVTDAFVPRLPATSLPEKEPR